MAKSDPVQSRYRRPGPRARRPSRSFWNPLGADDRAALAAARSGRPPRRKRDRPGSPTSMMWPTTRRSPAACRCFRRPTTMVIGPDMKARTIVGYTEASEIDQLVGDVRAKR